MCEDPERFFIPLCLCSRSIFLFYSNNVVSQARQNQRNGSSLVSATVKIINRLIMSVILTRVILDTRRPSGVQKPHSRISAEWFRLLAWKENLFFLFSLFVWTLWSRSYGNMSGKKLQDSSEICSLAASFLWIHHTVQRKLFLLIKSTGGRWRATDFWTPPENYVTECMCCRHLKLSL